MSDGSTAHAYQSERRMIQFRARIWKRIHEDSKYRSWMATTKDSQMSSQMQMASKSKLPPRQTRSHMFCHNFLQLPGEIRNQIYDELLKGDPKRQDTPLFRSVYVTKRSHSAATSTSLAILPISRNGELKYIGNNREIWRELFSRWLDVTIFQLTEAFELRTNDSSTSLRRKLKFWKHDAEFLPFTRYLSHESSRVFDNSPSWFFTMQRCVLSMHVLRIAAPEFRSSAVLISSLRSIALAVADVFKAAKDLVHLSIHIYLWPDDYQASSSIATWNGRKPPNKTLIWTGFEPIQQIPGIQSVFVTAGSVDQGWSAKRNSKWPHS